MIYSVVNIYWEQLIGRVKRMVSSFKDANAMPDEMKTTWECYAYFRWINDTHASMYEHDIVDPQCALACERLSEFQAAVLLAFMWDEYIQDCDVENQRPDNMSLASKRSALASVLMKKVYEVASSDGAEIEERRMRS